MPEFQMITYYLSWFVTVVVGLLTFLLVRHYMKMRSLPPGPFPLPLLGNVLELRGKDVLLQDVLLKYGKKYNGMYTFWMGPNPSVIVMSWDLVREALITRKHDFSGRVQHPFLELAFPNGGTNVIFADYGPCWESLRKILISAVRKYSVSEKLADLVSDVVDRSVEKMLKEEQPVQALNYTYLIVYNVMATSAFGKRYEMDDPEFLTIRNFSEQKLETFQKVIPVFLFPALALFYKKQIQEVLTVQNTFLSIMEAKYEEHKETYQKGDVRDFTDALLSAKEEAEEEGKDSQEFLVDKNLKLVLFDVFTAGSDTTEITLRWILLIISDKPDIQRKMQAEIDENIGSRSPRQEDKRTCPYTQAVIIEALRFRSVNFLSLEHKSICDTEIGGHKIPKNTSCFFHILNVHMDENLWEDPTEFKPERFLDQNGRLDKNRPDGFMAFGNGRRSCPGEKLALADLFLILTRLLQKVDLQLENGPGSGDLEPVIQDMICIPKKYNLLVKERHS